MHGSEGELGWATTPSILTHWYSNIKVRYTPSRAPFPGNPVKHHDGDRYNIRVNSREADESIYQPRL